MKKNILKKQFSIVETQVDENASSENPKFRGKVSVGFCWQGLALQ